MTQPKLSKLSLWGEPSSNPKVEGRAYRHPITGERYPSVTTVLKMADKSGLAQWAADNAMKWAVQNWMLLSERSDEKAYNLGRFQWNKVRDERAEVGTGVHEYIEAEHTGSWDFPELDEEQEQIIERWEEFKAEHTVTPILSEFTVFNEKAGVMGTADGLWDIDGVRTLVDVKTSRNHWPEHDAQLAALANADVWFDESEEMGWVERPRPEFDAVAIVHLRADLQELIPVTDLDLHYQKYLAYKTLWDCTQELKARAKEQESEIKAVAKLAEDW